ncbi:MAG: EF-hand domain-containing protein [Pseudomonadota bacterium]
MAKLSEEALASARKQFQFFDEDNNGYISFDEFEELLNTITSNVSTSQAAEGFSMVDTDSDGRVSFDEFITWWQTAWYEF